MDQNNSLDDRIDQLRGEIQGLESDSSIDSEDFARLKQLQRELQDLEAKQELLELEKKPIVRPLAPRDLRLLQNLVDGYPGFAKMREDERLDALILGLLRGCGFSAINLERVQEAIQGLKIQFGLNIQEHLSKATWINREGEERRRYLSPYQGVFKLDPGYILKLNTQSEVPAEEAPLRKRAEVKEVVEQVQQKDSTSGEEARGSEDPKERKGSEIPSIIQNEPRADRSPFRVWIIVGFLTLVATILIFLATR